ncbi:hypothetical protein CMK15_10295, partial [Candidatus Poribacteria bacterium]|nr:hypothetical protein [Candidatus Poribacteria bacterium]
EIGEASKSDGDKSNFVTFPGNIDFSKDFNWMCWIETEFYFVKLDRLVVMLKARKLGGFPIRYDLLM